MAKLSNSIIINAPVEKIFDFMDDPNNLVGVWPNMTDVSNVKKLPNGGVCYTYAYKVAGIRLEGTSEDVEHIQNVRTVSKTTGGLDGLATVEFEPVGSGTKVTIINEFTMPVPLIGKLAEAVAVKVGDQDAEALLANLKKRMEA